MEVLVTGVDSIGNKPGLAVMHSLYDQNPSKFRLLAADYMPESGGLFSDIPKKSFVVSHPTLTEKELARVPPIYNWTRINKYYVQQIQRIVQKEGVNVIIPTLSMEMHVYAGMAASLERLGAHLAVPSLEAVSIVNDKKLTFELAENLHIEYPRTILANSWEELEGTASKAGFKYPVVVKSRRHGVIFVTSDEELRLAYSFLSRTWEEPPLIQQYVKGDVYCVSAVGDHGSPAGLVAMKKLATDDKGTTTMGVTVRNEPLAKHTRTIMSALNWHGPIETEWILDSASDSYKLIEANSRFPCWIYLSCMAGLNLPVLATDIATGNTKSSLKIVDYRKGVYFVRNMIDSPVKKERLEVLAGAKSGFSWSRLAATFGSTK